MGSRLPDTSVPTHTVVDRAMSGSQQAVDALCERYRPRHVTWASGRLPGFARGMLDTDDIPFRRRLSVRFGIFRGLRIGRTGFCITFGPQFGIAF